MSASTVPEKVIADTTEPELIDIVDRAVVAAAALAAASLLERAALLRSVADRLEGAPADLVELAMAESGLSEARLKGELARTTFQLRFFADIVADGSFLGATIDHADPAWPPAPRPDLRRLLTPLGPVVVFAGSNFPFAFSVAGGDTSSALAAGCPVVLKVHPGHPHLSVATAELVRAGARDAGFPGDVLQLVHGEAAGRASVLHPSIRAGAFTGSLAGGRALFDLATSRAEPIPFYGELGSLNPIFVTPTAAAERLPEIAAGFRDSFNLSAGQFCTKPGLLVLPDSVDLNVVTQGISDVASATMLSTRIRDGYQHRLAELESVEGVTTLVRGGRQGERGATPTLLLTTAEVALRSGHEVLAECFGPTSVVVLYRDESELFALVAALDGQLTAGVFGSDGDALAARLVSELATKAGRVMVGAWPTGVAVTWAMQHGGPYPATTASASTSVGAAAIERFLRPVSYQSVPDAMLPAAVKEANPLGIPRMVDGVRVPGAERLDT